MNLSAHCDPEIEQMPAQIAAESPRASALELVPHVLDGSDEATLVSQARSGSPAAIEQLVGRYEPRLFRLAQNITGNHEDAEECVQNAFVKAFQNLVSFRGDSRFYTWLVRIAVNEGLMKIRRRRFTELSIDAALNDGKDEDELIPYQLKDWGPNPEESYSQEELRRILETAITELDPAYRVVFGLRDIEGFSTEETAQTLALSIAAVKTRLRRARLWLRNSLNVYLQAANVPCERSRQPETFRGSGRRAIGANDQSAKRDRVRSRG